MGGRSCQIGNEFGRIWCKKSSDVCSSDLITSDDLVSVALLDLPKRWHNYRDSVNGREKLPDWERLWSNLVHEDRKSVV